MWLKLFWNCYSIYRSHSGLRVALTKLLFCMISGKLSGENCKFIFKRNFIPLCPTLTGFENIVNLSSKQIRISSRFPNLVLDRWASRKCHSHTFCFLHLGKAFREVRLMMFLHKSANLLDRYLLILEFKVGHELRHGLRTHEG